MTFNGTIIAIIAALFIGLASGAFLGYRYASGRCAVEQVDQAKETVKAAVEVVETAREQQTENVKQTVKASKKETAIQNRQIEESKTYEQTIKPDACVMPADTFSLLNAAIDAANANIAPASD
jgi:hypothetical protein